VSDRAAGGERFARLAQQLIETQDVAHDFLTPELREMLDLIAAQPELRFFVDGTRNLGHQASTVLLMRRLIDRTQYAGRVTMVYAEYDKPLLGRTTEKLALLFPGIDPAHLEQCIATHGTCTRIAFRRLSAAHPLEEEVAFGFSGGADEMGVDYCAALNVRHFVRLQPYLWDDDASRKEDPYYESSRIEQPGGRYLYPVDVFPAFRELAFKHEKARAGVIDDAIWHWYAETQQFDPGLKVRTRNARCLWQLRESERNASFWPIYGLQHFGEQVPRIMLNLALVALELTESLSMPIVAVLFSPPEKTAGWDEFVEPMSIDLETGDAAMPRLCEALAAKYASDPTSAAAAARIAPLAGHLRAGIGAAARLRLLSGFDEASGEYLDLSSSARAHAVNAGRNDVTFISVGSVPMDVFLAWYAVSEIPGVLEGQTTSGVAVSTGKPFVQLLREEHVIKNGYPAGLPNRQHAHISQLLNDVALDLRNRSLGQCLAAADAEAAFGDYLAAIERVARLLRDVTRDGSRNARYFQEVGEYFQKELHDKLMVGLLALWADMHATP
jgi:hypothetical protein